MARVPDTPYPTVEPQGAERSGYDINANPSEFGGLIGQGEQKLGAGAEQAGNELFNTAVQVQQRHNEVAVDGAFNQLQQKNLSRLFGDPNDSNNKGYFALRGRDAMDAQAPTVAGMESDRDEIANGLQNSAQRLLFEQQSRRMNMYQQESIGRHAALQSSVWDQQTQQAAEAIKLRAIGANPFDNGDFLHNLADGEFSAKKKAASAGGGPDIIQDAADKFHQNAYAQRALAMAGTNPTAALQFLQTNQKEFAPQTFDALQSRFQNDHEKGAVAGAAQNVIGGAPGSTSQTAPSNAIAGAIKGQEGSSASDVSGKGARGEWQIMPATFSQYAQPGESIVRKADNEAVGRRIIDDYTQKYNGDPARVAVAYFSGPGNVAPAGSPTPWIEDKNDGPGGKGGTATSAYVRGVLGRLGQQSPTTGAPGPALQGAQGPVAQHTPEAFTAEQDMVNRAWTEAQSKFPDRPDLQRQVVGLVYEHIQQANVLQAKYEAEQAKQTRDNQEAAGQNIIKTLMTQPDKFDPKMIANDPSLTWEQKEHLWNISQQHFNGEGAHDVKTYGTGFYDLYRSVHAPEGDPTRVTDPSQLWGHVGSNGDLTLAGVEKLTQEIQGRRSPEGESESEMRKQFLSNARSQITGSNDGLHLRDPKGDELFLKFMAQALPAYDEGRKKGLSAAQLLDPSSKDYVGASVSTFKRPMAVWVKDMMEQNEPGVAAAPAAAGTGAAAPDLNSREGIVAAFRAGKLSRADAAAALVSKGFAAAPAAPAPAPPTPGSLVPTQ